MPVMENEKKILPEEPRPKEKLELPPESKKPESLLTVISPIHQKHMARVDNMNLKIAVCEDKINRNNAKISDFKEKIERLENTNTMLKAIGSKIPGVAAVIAANEKRIENIINKKIPNLEAKIENQKDNIQYYTKKRDISQSKADKLEALSGIIKSFTIPNPAEKRILFAESMDKLNDSSRKLLNFKLEKCSNELNELITRYEKTSSSAEKVELQEKINKLQKKQNNLNTKIDKIDQKTVPFKEMNDNSLDKTITSTEKIITENIEQPVSKINEKIINIDNEGKAPEKNIENAEKINPEYFKSLSKNDRAINVEPGAVLAGKIMAELEKRNIPFSAVKRPNDTVAITVAKKDIQYFNAAKQIAKDSCIKEYPKKEPATKTQKEAGNKQAFFSRKGLNKEAANASKQKSEPTVNKKKEQTL